MSMKNSPSVLLDLPSVILVAVVAEEISMLPPLACKTVLHHIHMIPFKIILIEEKGERELLGILGVNPVIQDVLINLTTTMIVEQVVVEEVGMISLKTIGINI